MHSQLAREFAETAERLQKPARSRELLDAIIALAAPTLECNHVGLLLCGRGLALRRGQASDSEAAEADQVQIAVRQGPCWSCLARPDGPAKILVEDTADESRWPAWNGPVAELGVRSVLTFRLETVDRTVGFLSWYDDAPYGFTPDAIAIARVVALHTATSVTQTLEPKSATTGDHPPARQPLASTVS